MPDFRSRMLAVALLLVALVGTACSDGGDARVAEELGVVDSTGVAEEPGVTDSTGVAEEPGVVDSTGVAEEPGVTEPERPQRIVSLSPTATEMLFAIGAGEQVVAVEEFSNYPPGTPVTNLSGWNPNVEAVLSYEPDLVVISNDANDLVAGLNAAGVAVHLSPAPMNLEAWYGTFAELGIATGRVDETADLVVRLRGEVSAALEAAPNAPVRVYHELDDTFFSVSSAGFIGAVYSAMGASNIADQADGVGSGYPQLTEEYIVEADPELIVITDQVSYTAEDVAARPGWGEVAAVRNGNIVTVNADIASRWGPRLPQFIAAIAEALQSVVEPISLEPVHG